MTNKKFDELRDEVKQVTTGSCFDIIECKQLIRELFDELSCAFEALQVISSEATVSVQNKHVKFIFLNLKKNGDTLTVSRE